MKTEHPSRRQFLQAAIATPATLWLASCVAPVTPGPSVEPVVEAPAADLLPTVTPVTEAVAQQALAPTPACGDDDEPTPAQTEGPYYTPNTPERASFLEPDLTGDHLAVGGYVLTTSCQPVARALLDFWHCDAGGVYDNTGYRLRGHLFSGEDGSWTLETIMPGVYPGRTRHIHVKVQAPNQPVLTTQLYFPDEPGNQSDGIFRPELVMDVQDAGDGSKSATFNFVLAL
jgi:protocatechuate 3,4-dioxygenase beta subunit